MADRREHEERFIAGMADVVRCETPSEAYHQLVRVASTFWNATAARIYMLSRSDGSYHDVASCGQPDAPERLKVSSFRARSVDDLTPLQATTVRRSHYRALEPGHPQRVVLAINKGTTCIGMLDLQGGGSDSPPLAAARGFGVAPVLEAAAINIYEKAHSLSILSESQKPLDFTLPEREFLEELMLLASVSSGMEYVALREYDENDEALRCVAHFGFAADVPEDLLDLEETAEYDPFLEVVKTRSPHVARDMLAPKYDRLRERPELKMVRSFVALPVMVGTDFFGTLSFAATVEYDYSDSEVSSLTAVANGIGVALTNQRNFHFATETVARLVDVGTAITGLEISQSVRHEILGYSANYSEALLAMKRGFVGQLPARLRVDLQTYVDRLEEGLSDMHTALDKIGVITGLPKADRVETDLAAVWNDAVEQVRGRIGMARVDVSAWQGTPYRVMAAPDFVRQVFAHLLLNSCDAFALGNGPKRGRKIQLRAAETRGKSPQVEIWYTDNAGGINPAALRAPDRDGEVLSVASVFEQRVTSKRGGTGWGLYLVRSILTDHGGSIDLLDYRNGVRFRIAMPKLTG